VLYTLIIRALKKREARRSDKSASKMRGSQKRATQVAIMILAIFFICWFPFYFIECYKLHFPEENFPRDFIYTSAGKSIYALATTLCLLHSVINPIVYTLSMDHFKKGIKKIICCSKIKETGRTLSIRGTSNQETQL